MSFCAKCGSKLPEGSKFCLNCGAPVEEVQPKKVAQPAQQPVQQPAQQPVQPVQQPVRQPVQQPTQAPVQPAQQYAAENAAPKAPGKKVNIKLWIILGAVATVVIVAVIIFFTVIFPEITARHINMGNYVKAKFYSTKYVDGYVKGYMNLDLEKAYDDIVQNDSISKYEFNRYFSSYNLEFKNKKASDTIVEPVEFESKVNNIGELERKLGVRFDKEVKSQMKLGDQLNSQKIVVEEPVEIDLFRYIDKCYYNTGIHQKDVVVNLKQKTFKGDGYSVEVTGFTGTYGSNSCSIYIKNKNQSSGYVKVESSKDKGKNGSKAKFFLTFTASDDNKSLISGTPFIITKMSKNYKIKTQKSLTRNQAGEYLGVVRKKVKYIFGSGSFRMDESGYYLFTARNKNAKTVNMLIALISKHSKTSDSKYFAAYIVKNCYIDKTREKKADRFIYETTDIKYNYKKLSGLWKTIKNAWADDYKIQRVD